jgi:class 3 adenylate cyclase
VSAGRERGEAAAVLFADICDSTRLYETLGDEEAFGRIGACIGALALLVERQGGVVVKTIGDEVMAAFARADDALIAAEAMTGGRAAGLLPVRAAFHWGAVIRSGGDVFGDTVNVASRLAAMARAGEVLLSAEAADALAASLRGKVRLIDAASVRGRAEPVRIYGIARGDVHATQIVRPGGEARSPAAASLLLRHRGARYLVGHRQPKFVLGREDECDLVVPSAFVSRHHAEIEIRRGRYFISDKSTNGTHLTPLSGETVVLRRDGMQLPSAGTISLGQAPADNTDDLIDFSIGDRDGG